MESTKKYTKDQSKEWKSKYYIPVLSNLMNTDFTGGKKYNLNTVFNQVLKPLQQEFNSNYLGLNYDKEIKLFVWHAAKMVRKNINSLHVTRNKNSFTNKDLSYTKFIELLNSLESAGYGENFVGNKAYSESLSIDPASRKGFSKKSVKRVEHKTHHSLFVMSDKFVNLFKGINKDLYPKHEFISPKDTVQLRISVGMFDKDGSPILDKNGNQKTKKQRKEGTIRGSRPIKAEVNDLNTFLRTVDITNEFGQDLTVEYYRIYGDSLNEYGRFFSSYSTLTKEFRRGLIIQGEKVIECDYESNHPRILAEKEGIDLPFDFEAYTTQNRSNILTGFNTEDHRTIYKIALIACLSARTKQGLVSSVKSGLESAGFNLPNGLATKIVEDLKQHNYFIAKYFGADMAAELQNIDSNIASIIMKGLMDNKVGFMCYHDSFIVPRSKEGLLIDLMHKAWKEVLGSDFNCITDSSILEEKETTPTAQAEIFTSEPEYNANPANYCHCGVRLDCYGNCTDVDCESFDLPF